MQKDFYDMLLANAKEASQRARWIFTVAIIVSLVQLGAVYNFGYSETRDYVEDLVFRDGMLRGMQLPSPRPPPAAVASAAAQRGVGEAALKELRTQMIRSWVEEQTFTISLLGIRMHAADAGLLGSLAMISVMVWLFHGVRRENRLVAAILGIATAEPASTRAFVYHALAGSQLFSRLEPFHSGGRGVRSDRPASGLASLLTYLPAITLLVMVAVDLQSVFRFDAVHRGLEGALFLHRWPSWRFFFWIAMESLAFAAAWRLCYLTHWLQKDTQAQLQSVQEWDVTWPEAETVAERLRASVGR